MVGAEELSSYPRARRTREGGAGASQLAWRVLEDLWALVVEDWPTEHRRNHWESEQEVSGVESKVVRWSAAVGGSELVWVCSVGAGKMVWVCTLALDSMMAFASCQIYHQGRKVCQGSGF